MDNDMTFTAEDNGDGTATLITSGGSGSVVVTASKISFQDAQTGVQAVATMAAAADAYTGPFAEGVWMFAAVQGGTVVAFVRLDMGAAGGAVVTRIRAAIKARILALALPPAVEEQWTTDETNLEFPAIVLSPGEGMGETDENGMSLTDDVGYPILVEIFDRCDVLDHSSLPDWEGWRQTIIRAFRNRPLDAVRESIICRIEYGPIVENNLPKYQFLMSRFLIRAVAREHRTT